MLSCHGDGVFPTLDGGLGTVGAALAMFGKLSSVHDLLVCMCQIKVLFSFWMCMSTNLVSGIWFVKCSNNYQ